MPILLLPPRQLAQLALMHGMASCAAAVLGAAVVATVSRSAATPSCSAPTLPAGIDLSPHMIAVGRYLQSQRNAERAAAGQQPEQLRFVHGEAARVRTQPQQRACLA